MRYQSFVRISTCVLATFGAMVAAAAGWQPTQIKVGDVQGGFVYYAAERQAIIQPGGSPTGPRYLPSGLVTMDNGTVALVTTYLNNSAPGNHPQIAFSPDNGDTWSSFQNLPGSGRPMMFTYLGGGNLSYIGGYTRYFSSDYGQHWTESAAVPGFLNGSFEAEGNDYVDRNPDGSAAKVWEIGFLDTGSGFPAKPFTSYLHSSTDGGRTWGPYTTSPNWKFDVTYNGNTYTRGTCEGAIVRAANGWLVAALRTDVPPRFYSYGTDDLMGTAISISQDDGQTWSPLNLLYDAGRHHANLQRLPNGDLLLTNILRDDVNMGASGLASHNRGLEALLSHDNGLTWNLDKRITLDEFDYYNSSDWTAAMAGHLASTVLADGSVLSVYGHHLDGSAVLVKWNPATLPEPSACVMLAAGGSVLLAARRCRLWRARRAAKRCISK